MTRRIRHRQAQVVVAVPRSTIAARPRLHIRRSAARIPAASNNRRIRDLTVLAPARTTALLLRKSGVGARAVLGAEFHVVDTFVAPAPYRRAWLSSSTCCTRLLQLELEMNVAGRDGANARPPGRLQRVRRPFDVQRAGARHLPTTRTHGSSCATVSTASVVAFARNRESGFHNVHTQLGQLVRHAELLGRVHAAARRLILSRSVVSKI